MFKCSYEANNSQKRDKLIYERKSKIMKKYKIEVDCAACALKMEEAAKKTKGVKDATVAFMTQKMNVEFEEDVESNEVMQQVLKACKKVEPDCEIFI
jgi:cation transport ATPase